MADLNEANKRVAPPKPLYRAGCCVQCGKKIRNPDKYQPVFLIPSGEPVYLHPKCEAEYNGTD